MLAFDRRERLVDFSDFFFEVVPLLFMMGKVKGVFVDNSTTEEGKVLVPSFFEIQICPPKMRVYI